MSDSVSTEQRVLVVSESAGLSNEDKVVLREAGILVITVRDVSQVRLMTAEPWPFDSNALTQAALGTLASCGDYTKARAWMALMKTMESGK